MYARGGPRPQPGTLNQLFVEAVEKFDKPDAMLVRVGEHFGQVLFEATMTDPAVDAAPSAGRALTTRVRCTVRIVERLLSRG